MNVLTLALTAFLASTCALARDEEGDQHLRGNEGRRLVMDGTEVSESAYPSHVRILLKDSNFNFPVCGGTLIGPRVVLTAKHCEDYGGIGGIAVKYNPQEVFNVDMGTVYEYDKSLRGAQERKHPTLDLMLLKVEGQNITANGRRPAKIRRDTQYPGGFSAGVEVNIAGGGSTDSTKINRDCLATGYNKADVQVEDCPSGWDSTVLCARNRDSKLCATDSGTGVIQQRWPNGWFGLGFAQGGEDVLVGVVGIDYNGTDLGCDALEGPGAGDTMPTPLCRCAKTFSSLVRIGTDEVISWIEDKMVNDFKVEPPIVLDNGKPFWIP